MPRSTRNLAARRVALATAGLSAAWAVWLMAYGGFEAHVFGVRIKSDEPVRALLASSAGFAAYAALTRGQVLAVWSDALHQFDRRLVAVLLATATTAVALMYATTAATGPDPYGYVSEADVWLNGSLKVEQPWARLVPWPSGDWTFSPLGYRPAPHQDAAPAAAIVPIYSPGLPLLMAAFKRIAG